MASRKPGRSDTQQRTTSAQEQGAESELSALGNTTGAIAHDLNNALTGILGRAQLALGQSKDKEVTRHLKIIEQSTLDAAQAVRRLHQLAQALKDHRFH